MGLPVNIKQNICPVRSISQELKPDAALQEACRQLCQEFPDLFKAELGCLKDFELDVKFKADAKPVFCKPQVVPFAIQEDLSIAYDAGIARGVWQSVQFNNYGTPVVSIRKVTLPGQNFEYCMWGLFSDSEPTAGTTSPPYTMPRGLDAEAGWWLWIHQN